MFIPLKGMTVLSMFVCSSSHLAGKFRLVRTVTYRPVAGKLVCPGLVGSHDPSARRGRSAGWRRQPGAKGYATGS